MARTKEQNERMTMATRKKIMEAGLVLFAQKGFALTSIKDIAEAAGISTGLIYRHFSSKEDPFNSLIANTIEELNKFIQILDSYDSPKQAIVEMTASLIGDIHFSNELSRYFLIVIRSMLEEEVLSQIDEFRKSILSLYDKTKDLIKEGQKRGEFKQGNPYKYTLLFFSIIQGMANMKLFMGDKYVAPELDDVLGFLLI
ncbi:MAG: TetR/AcrR family transcriptional regulator [Clostridiaceae bacterium]|jgi:AcrR family transcriptional regulator|nr:TetR/AcrR family transcriptional regulator [Clostridiaceae bacterium]